MPKIGSFGGVTFEVSAKKVLTFDEFSRSGGARWATHDVILQKPIPEFLGPGQEGLSFKIVLKATHGVSPDKELDKLRSFRDKGKTSTFVIGSKPITSNNWYIEDISEDHKTIDGKGRILSIDATITAKEYPITAKKKVQPKVKASSAPTSKRKSIGKITVKVGMLNCRSSASLKGHIVKVLKKNQSFTVYGTKTTDIKWFDLGGGKWCSASSKYVSFKKG